MQSSKDRHNYPESVDSSNVDYEEDYMQIDKKVTI